MGNSQFRAMAGANNIDECMVTVAKYLEQVKEVEKCPFLSIEEIIIPHGGIPDIDINEYYIVKYPYEEPVCPELTKLNADDIFDEVADEWIDKIMHRAIPRLHYMINKKMYNELFNRNKVGVIIHYYTGELIPFEYEKLAGFDIVVQHTVLASMYKMLTVRTAVEFYDIMSNIKNDTWTMYFTIKFNTPDGDMYNNADELNLYAYIPLDRDHLSNIIETIKIHIWLKKKIIMLP